MDNSAAERAPRAVALVRKNYLYADSVDGGERGAAIYSLLGTANLDGEFYLRRILEQVADHPIYRIQEMFAPGITVLPGGRHLNHLNFASQQQHRGMPR